MLTLFTNFGIGPAVFQCIVHTSANAINHRIHQGSFHRAAIYPSQVPTLSTHKYPPARALAAEALRDSELEWPALSARMERLLTHYFEGQATSGFRLLKCLEDHGDSLEMGGYGGVGHDYWVLASDGEKLTWLSDHDYGVHLAPIAEFEVPAGCNLPACVAPVPN